MAAFQTTAVLYLLAGILSLAPTIHATGKQVFTLLFIASGSMHETCILQEKTRFFTLPSIKELSKVSWLCFPLPPSVVLTLFPNYFDCILNFIGVLCKPCRGGMTSWVKVSAMFSWLMNIYHSPIGRKVYSVSEWVIVELGWICNHYLPHIIVEEYVVSFLVQCGRDGHNFRTAWLHINASSWWVIARIVCHLLSYLH